MGRLIQALLLGLIGAGIVHIAVLLLVPVYSDRNAWSRISAYGGSYRFHVLETETDGRGGLHDPLFQEAACRFDLLDGPVRVTAAGNVPFWSVSIYNRSGENLYSFNDRTSTDGKLDLVIANPIQMIDLKKDLPEAAAQSILVEEDIGEGFVVIRGFTPDQSWQSSVRNFLSDADCLSLPM
ncbi:DUF1254 domain-containing protein [Phyllobacterium phragmitis]|uniref:DUF1254 domain-containing protein n=1 Tax=Phyllobacterium phragmitis TaxID=2670329 RepID=A0A2S9IZ30_9HYPH|nr:DUF1254 domain-containing protein [Phyllobacterium phragmitis]PRD45791.1 DUF1254 domain-containing protein [Phyllobacterium phragmitis]